MRKNRKSARGCAPWDGLQADVGDKQLGEDALAGPLPHRVEHHLRAAIGVLTVAQNFVMHSQREPLLEACMRQALSFHECSATE